jgi:6-pyruvoyltetrahydropterin/6-carboxytetrahydropterin synthase
VIELTREYRFAASHRLHSHQLSQDANRETYGKCNNPYGHGHNYRVLVTVAGEIDKKWGRVVDVTRLDSVVRQAIIEPMDHRHLNDEVPEFARLVPTTENLADVVDARLRAAWPADLPALRRVRIFETRNNTFEIGHV